MKQHKMLKVLSSICCIIGLVISLFGLIFGINGFGAEGWYIYNAVYIPYSIAAFLILMFDLLITVNVIKKGFLFSCISSIIKTGMIAICLPDFILEYINNLESGNSAFGYSTLCLVSLMIMSIPSLVNAFSKWHCFENRCLEKSGVLSNKQPKILKGFAVICCCIGILMSLLSFYAGVISANADGFGRLGVLFVIPSLFALLVIMFDLLITANVIKIGFLYSCISSLLKLDITLRLLPYTISELREEMENGYSNFDLFFWLVTFLIIIAIPSVINTFSRWRGFKNRWFKKGTL